MHLHGLPIAVNDCNNASGVGIIYGSPSIQIMFPINLDKTITILEQNGAIPSLKQVSKLNFEEACCFQLSKAETLFRLSFASPKSIHVFSL